MTNTNQLPDVASKPGKRSVSLTWREARDLGEFGKRHQACRVYVTAEDGSGIGQTVKAHCKDCKVFKNITDYEAW